MQKAITFTEKALSGYAEWFWLMAKNWKDVENRSWALWRYFKPMELPVRVYLHASKTPTPPDEMEFIRQRLDEFQLQEFNRFDFNSIRGTIFARITITGNVTALSSPWFFGSNGFLVSDGSFIEKPIPYRGSLGFFSVKVN